MFDGRLPSNTRCGTSQSGVPSALTCSAVLPNASASALREHVGHQHVVMPAERIERLAEGDEVARNQPRALMDQLIERVLAVGARLAPVDRAGVVIDRLRRRACTCLPLLSIVSCCKIRRESASGIARRAARRRSARRRNRCTRRASRPISTGRFCSNGAVRKCSSISWKPREHRAEVVRPDREHRREADRRIHRIAAADPIPEAEHVGGVDAELRDFRGVGRDGDEMLGDGRFVAASCPSSQSRAVCALVIVSSVVNVFEEMMNSVSADRDRCTASAKSVPSTFETKRNVMSRSL